MAIGKKFKSLVERLRAPEELVSPWRPLGAPYPLLLNFDPVAVGILASPGLIAIWHLGVRPQWLKVAAASNLQAAIRSAEQTQSIVSYRPNGGVYLAWAPYQTVSIVGVTRFLIERLKPTLQAARIVGELDIPPDTKPVSFPLPPGTME
jgi:hypothetical protein